MREKEYNYFATHPEIFNKYKGEYIAIIDEKIVEHGRDIKEVSRKAEKIEKDPFIAKIPKEEVLVV